MDNESAFPLQRIDMPTKYASFGLTKREWFAGMALIALLSSEAGIVGYLGAGALKTTEAAFTLADAMIAESKKEEKK